MKKDALRRREEKEKRKRKKKEEGREWKGCHVLYYISKEVWDRVQGRFNFRLKWESFQHFRQGKRAVFL
jgi:hypothetical protein